MLVSENVRRAVIDMFGEDVADKIIKLTCKQFVVAGGMRNAAKLLGLRSGKKYAGRSLDDVVADVKRTVADLEQKKRQYENAERTAYQDLGKRLFRLYRRRLLKIATKMKFRKSAWITAIATCCLTSLIFFASAG